MIFKPHHSFETGCGGVGMLTGDTLLSKPRQEVIDALCDVPREPAEMAQILRNNQGREGSTP